MTFVPAPDPVGFRRLDPIRARDASPGTRPPTPLLVTATATTDRDTGRIATAGGIASAVAHGALILWLLLGGRIFQPAHAPAVAAVSVSSTVEHMDEARMQALILEVKDIARQISSDLGYAGTTAHRPG